MKKLFIYLVLLVSIGYGQEKKDSFSIAYDQISKKMHRFLSSQSQTRQNLSKIIDHTPIPLGAFLFYYGVGGYKTLDNYSVAKQLAIASCFVIGAAILKKEYYN